VTAPARSGAPSSAAATAPGGLEHDPATLEIVRHALGSVADEMALIIARTAYSATVRDALDYSTALLNPQGELIAQGLGIALHLGSFPSAVSAVLRGYGDRLQPGDVFVLNDPYGWGGIHLPDIYLVKPVFHDGRLSAIAACLAHHTDVGGAIPSSNSTTTTEVFQEGLRIPGIYLYEAGRVNQAVLDIIAANVRVPHKVLGDLRAQLAAVDAGERGYLDLLRRYGPEQLTLLEDALLTLTERMARREIEGFPDGVYRQAAWIDSDSVDPDPIRIAVAVTIEGDSITVDFDGTSPQVRGGINSPFPFSKSATYAATRLVLDRSIPNSGGYFRAITIRADEGTIVNPRFPAACGARGITGFRIMDAVAGALAQAAPDRVPADGEGGNSIISLGGKDSRGDSFIYVDMFSGARGGGPGFDGPSGVPHPGSNNANMPIEIAESTYPLRFHRYGIVEDSASPGQWRGSPALVREFTYLGADTEVQVRSDKRDHPPFGLAGGAPGRPSMTTVDHDGEVTVRPVIGPSPLRTGDIFRHELASGAGWGDPLDRDPAAVVRDVRNGVVSAERAASEHAVILGPGEILDAAATLEARNRRRAERDGAASS
jgi:N-methylhydantoinase B